MVGGRRTYPFTRTLVLDVVLGEFLSWMAVTSSAGELRPEVHLELAELHGLLARRCRQRGWRGLAARLAARSALHWEAGGGGDPGLPPALAAAVAVPGGERRRPWPPEDGGRPTRGDGRLEGVLSWTFE